MHTIYARKPIARISEIPLDALPTLAHSLIYSKLITKNASNNNFEYIDIKFKIILYPRNESRYTAK